MDEEAGVNEPFTFYELEPPRHLLPKRIFFEGWIELSRLIQLPPQPRVTLFLPTYNEEEAIQECLEAILQQDYPHEHIEVLVVDGMSDDATVTRVKQVIEQAARQEQNGISFRILQNPARELASAWNLAAEQASGDVIALVVAHSVIAEDFVSRAVHHLQHDDADVVGGPYRMVGKGILGRAIAAAMSCPFGVGQSLYRYGGDVEDIDSVANAIYPLELLRRFVPFDKHVGKGRGQDWEIHYRMRQEGVKFSQYADIRYVFYGRHSLRRLWHQYFTWANAKVGMMRKHSVEVVRLSHFAPMCLVLWVVLGGAAVALLPSFMPIWGVGLGLYALGLVVFSVRMALSRGLGILPVIPFIFLIMHTAYGIGMIWEFVFGKKPASAPA